MSDHLRPLPSRSEAPGAVPGVPVPDEPYCTSCGHLEQRHRRGRCWTDWRGEPVSRRTSLVECRCQGFTSELDDAISRHPAGKGLNDGA